MSIFARGIQKRLKLNVYIIHVGLWKHSVSLLNTSHNLLNRVLQRNHGVRVARSKGLLPVSYYLLCFMHN